MHKRYVVVLTEEERARLHTMIGRGVAPASALTHARIESPRVSPAGGSPELACAVAQEAAAIVASTWSARAVAELRRLPTLLAGWPDSAAVAELEATLAALP